MTMAPDVRLVDVTKRFDDVTAVDRLSLEIEHGSFFALLGPSGCGKTTTLRMIGGFEQPTEGQIYLGDAEVSGLPSYKRDVNTVFQSYALFPHLSIFENVAFGLRRQGIRGGTLTGQVNEILRLVGLEGLGKRKPRQLSGGQQQRVALARALVNKPKVLLLDEPLGALDLKLRKQMQLELKRIQHELGTTFVYVTHDQDEALAMSDRIAVMNGGSVEQVGAPREIYEHPATAFVADFIGSLNALDFVVGEVVGGFAVMRLGERDRIVAPVGPDTKVGDSFRVAVRPERVQIGGTTADGGSSVEGTIGEIVYLGMYTQFHVDTPAGRIVSHRLAEESFAQLGLESRVLLSWEPEYTSVLAET